MDEVEIDRQSLVARKVPIPDLSYARNVKYPWRKLKVGDSFFVGPRDAERVATAKTKAEARTGFRFVTRAEGDGRRVWRIA